MQQTLTAPFEGGREITLESNLSRDTRITRAGDTRITRLGDTRIVRFRAVSYLLTAEYDTYNLTAPVEAGTLASISRINERITRSGDVRITRDGHERIVRVRVFSRLLTAPEGD